MNASDENRTSLSKRRVLLSQSLHGKEIASQIANAHPPIPPFHLMLSLIYLSDPGQADAAGGPVKNAIPSNSAETTVFTVGQNLRSICWSSSRPKLIYRLFAPCG